MLLGSEIHIHTDHKNLTFANLNTQRVLWWQYYLEEYSPTMHYIKGQNNVIADDFSLFDRINDSQCLEGKNAPLEIPHELEQGCDIVQDAKMLEFFLNLPRLNDHGNNPLNYKYLAKQQVEDEKLQQLEKGKPENYVMKTLNGHKVLC